MMKRSDRLRDMQAEIAVSKLMDTVYRENGYMPCWIVDRESQMAGLDVSLVKNGIWYLVDEKAAITRLDGILSTFAFELYTSNNKDNIGWFVNKKCKNNYYSLIYLTSFANSIQKIDKIECILLNKDRIFKEVKSELDKKNIHFNNILDVMSKIPIASNGKKYLRLNRYMKIVYSLNVIPERPINVVIDKQYLLSVADDVLVKEF